MSTTLSSGPQRARRNDLRNVRDSCRPDGLEPQGATPTHPLTSRLRRRRCWARHLSPRGGAQGLSPWLGPGRDASTQRATPTWKPPSRPAFPGHAAQPEAPPATATRWTQPLPRRSLQFDKITPTGKTIVFDTGPVLRSSKSAGGGSVPNPAGAAGVLRSEHPRALQGSPALESGFQKPTAGLRPGNGWSSSRRIQSTPVSPLAVARSLRAQRFHTFRRKDHPRLRQPAALLSFPTARSPRPHHPPFD